MIDPFDELGDIGEAVIDIEGLPSLPTRERLILARRCADKAIGHELKRYEDGKAPDAFEARQSINWWKVVRRIRELDGDVVGAEVEKAYEKWKEKVSWELWEKYCSDVPPER